METGAPIRAISRSIAVLKAINRHGSLCMMSIAKASGLSYPTVCRVVRTLMHEGLIEKEPTRKHYRPTALVQELSVGYRPHSGLIAAARPHLTRITEEVGWPVSIASCVGMSMVLRDSTHAETTLTFEHYPPGFTFPLFESASGHLYLAYASDETVEKVRQWARQVQRQDEDAAAYPTNATLARIREQGYAVQAWGRHNLNPGRTSAISVPIFHDGEFDAALTLIYFAQAMKQSEAIKLYCPMLKRHAAAISLALDGVTEDRVKAGPSAPDKRQFLGAMGEA